MRNAIVSATALALALAGCNTDTTNSDLGGMRASLTLPDGTVINSINYSITGGPSAVTRNGAVSVENSATAQFREGNLPSGAGYSIALAATTVAGSPCAGTADFSIAANSFTGVTMQLVCGEGVVIDVNGNGDVEVDIDVVNQGSLQCPVVAGITALPLEVLVGFDIALSGAATSTDGTNYGWSGGTFSAPTSAATNYTCEVAGDHAVVFTVSKAGCSDSSMPVTLTCTGAPTGGAGGVGGTGGEAAVGGSAGTGGTGGEAAVGGSAGTGGVGGTGGEAAVGGSAGTGGVGGTGGTGGTPGPIAGLSEACGTCVISNCGEAQLGFDIAGPCFQNSADPAFQQRCVDAHVCSTLSADDCAQNAILGPVGCYCGEGVDPAACQAGTTVIGNCIPEWEAATGCTPGDSNCVMGLFSDLTLPSGYARFALECQLNACSTECF